jgi:hypothetical protein
MASEAQMRVNRATALRSTRPLSEQGKASAARDEEPCRSGGNLRKLALLGNFAAPQAAPLCQMASPLPLLRAAKGPSPKAA